MILHILSYSGFSGLAFTSIIFVHYPNRPLSSFSSIHIYIYTFTHHVLIDLLKCPSVPSVILSALVNIKQQTFLYEETEGIHADVMSFALSIVKTLFAYSGITFFACKAQHWNEFFKYKTQHLNQFSLFWNDYIHNYQMHKLNG